MNKGGRGITFPAMSMKQSNDLGNLPSSQSPFDPDNILAGSGSDISLVWNQDIFTCIQPCSLLGKAPTPKGALLPQRIEAVHACGQYTAISARYRGNKIQSGVIC